MTREVELIGDLGETPAFVEKLRSAAAGAWNEVINTLSDLPPSDTKKKVEAVLVNIRAQINAKPYDQKTLIMVNNKLRRIQKFLLVKRSDAKLNVDNMGNSMNVATGLDDRLVLGRNPDAKPRSVTLQPKPITVTSDVAMLYGVGGVDEEEAYLAETQMGYLGYNQNPDESAPWQYVDKPGAAPYETRIQESTSIEPQVVKTGDGSPTTKPSIEFTREKSASIVIEPPRKVVEEGRPLDVRAMRQRMKREGRVSDDIIRDRALEQIRGIDERFQKPYPIRTHRGGGHTMVEYDDEEYEDDEPENVQRY